MPFMPVGTITSPTATGDVVMGPGYPLCLMNGLPAICMGDAVVGPMCTGSITLTPSLVLFMGRPVATLASACVGVAPAALGVPSATVVAMTICPTYLY